MAFFIIYPIKHPFLFMQLALLFFLVNAYPKQAISLLSAIDFRARVENTIVSIIS